MYLTVHAAIGAIIGQQVDNPALALAGGFVSHFVFDFIPHGDEKVGELINSHKAKFIFIAGVDLTLTACLTVFILAVAGDLGYNPIVLLAGIVGAVLPDFLSMAFPQLHQLLKQHGLVTIVYKTLSWLSIPQMIARLNALHHRIHSVILRHYGFSLSFRWGLTLQLIFLSYLLTYLTR